MRRAMASGRRSGAGGGGGSLRGEMEAVEPEVRTLSVERRWARSGRDAHDELSRAPKGRPDSRAYQAEGHVDETTDSCKSVAPRKKRVKRVDKKKGTTSPLRQKASHARLAPIIPMYHFVARINRPRPHSLECPDLLVGGKGGSGAMEAQFW